MRSACRVQVSADERHLKCTATDGGLLRDVACLDGFMGGCHVYRMRAFLLLNPRDGLQLRQKKSRIYASMIEMK